MNGLVEKKGCGKNTTEVCFKTRLYYESVTLSAGENKRMASWFKCLRPGSFHILLNYGSYYYKVLLDKSLKEKLYHYKLGKCTELHMNIDSVCASVCVCRTPRVHILYVAERMKTLA